MEENNSVPAERQALTPEQASNPVFGRKIFFLNPSLVIQTIVIPKLRELEYEIYLINDCHKIKPLLAMYPKSILYINLDLELRPEQWVNFVKSFEGDENLNKTIVGVISERAKAQTRNNFLLGTHLAGGFISVGGVVSEVTRTLKGVFDVNDAKGRRKYVRANCRGQNLLLSVDYKSKSYNLQVLDISSVGLSVLSTARLNWDPGTVIRDAFMYINHLRCSCNLVSMAKKSTDEGDVFVMLFMQDTGEKTRTAARNFVFQIIQDKMLAVQQALPRDNTDYAKEPESQAGEML